MPADEITAARLRGPGHGSCAEQFGALAELREQGLIRHLGLSAATREHLDEAGRITPVVCVQHSYSLDHRRSAASRSCRSLPWPATPASRAPARRPTRRYGPCPAAHRVTTQQVRLAWALHRGPHILVIPGTGHLEQNVAAAERVGTGGALVVAGGEFAAAAAQRDL